MRPSTYLLSQTINALAKERRRVTSAWRLEILARRITVDDADPGVIDGPALAAAMLRRGMLRTIAGIQGIYVVSTPYADVVPLAEEHILQEAFPTAFLSHMTALTLHGLTDLVPGSISATAPEESARLPLGTMPEDWIEVSLPTPDRPPRINNKRVDWTRTSANGDLGIQTTFIHGGGVYVSNLERTLIDAITSPRKCHGIATVLRAWKEASSQWNLDRLVDYTEEIGGPVLTQRVGYLIERLGGYHARLSEWKEHLQRGSSLRLVASEPFSAQFSEEWNLSLNVPGGIIIEAFDQ